jgi:type I restriction enzyme M protein
MVTDTSISDVLLDILRDTNYALDVFSQEEVDEVRTRITTRKGKHYLPDFVDNKERPAKPEEIVRQLYLYRLIHTYKYPSSRIAVEKGVYFGSSVATKRADIVVSDKHDPNTAYIIVEVKKPKRSDGLEQLKSYCNAEGAPIAVWTNGSELVLLHREDPNIYRAITDLPRQDQTLAEVINEQITIDELAQRNKLVTERLTLRSIIRDLEDLVLANAGVDAFDEVFKLIYAKLYDEYMAENNPQRHRIVHFRAAGETYVDLYAKINGLLQEAKDHWRGVFLAGEKIELSPAHLAVCVSFLQDIKLFNSNLQIIDEAFEYLVTQVSKGEKGQYFTPRPVIDMAVKMLNPQWGEYVIDTAAGSCGFTVHTIFHVWGGELTSQKPEEWQREYASNRVYGLDFDARSVKIAQAINLIAGDGRTHVYRVNTLDPRNWDGRAREDLKERLHFFDDHAADEDNRKNMRYFNFDVLMTNPPFAGEIKDTRILHQYDIAQKADGRWQQSMGRDILFIERNLQFIKPGGRMAIVLPQGRFNNISDERIRRFITERCRVLAVVGLHGNTFKPHTGTKTSVLFLQKFTEAELHEQAAYRSEQQAAYETAVEQCGILEGDAAWQQKAEQHEYDDALLEALELLAERVIDEAPEQEEGQEKSDPRWEKAKRSIYEEQQANYVEQQFTRRYSYPAFFAVSEHGGKDNSGEYIYLDGPDGQPLLDLFGHRVVDHDLYDTHQAIKQQRDNLLKRYQDDERRCARIQADYEQLIQHIHPRQAIAESFQEWARAQGLLFAPAAGA